MRWFLTGVTVTVFGLVGSSAAQACGGCCGGGGGGKNCSSCPQHAAAHGAQRYWSSAYGSYLYYNPVTRLSYYWSEPHRSYYPVRDNPPGNPVPPGVAAAPRSSASSAYTAPYYNPDSRNGAASQGNPVPYGGQKTCPVRGAELGSMGPAVPVTVRGQTVYVCCQACVAKVQRDPDPHLRKVQAERTGR